MATIPLPKQVSTGQPFSSSVSATGYYTSFLDDRGILHIVTEFLDSVKLFKLISESKKNPQEAEDVRCLVLPALFGLGVHARHPDDPSGPPRRERLDFDGRNGTGGESEMKTAAQLGVGGHDFFGGIQMFDPIIAMFLRGALCP